jgi:hypothetical protein
LRFPARFAILQRRSKPPESCLMFSRASSLTKLSRGCRYLLRPSPAYISQAPFSLTARSFSAVGAAMAETSGVTVELLQKKLEDELEAKTVKIEDLSGKLLLPRVEFRSWRLYDSSY